MKQDKHDLGESRVKLEQAKMSQDTKALTLPRLNSAILFGGAQQLVIEHSGEEYLLRITKQGKLILTK